MKNLIQETIEKIKRENISPDPKWKFLARKYFLWGIFAVIVILAAISFSAAYDNAKNLDWDLYRFVPQNMIMYFLSIVPYFWVALIAIFLTAAFFEIRRTETGYRYSWLKIIIITVGGIVVLGTLISLLGFGGRFHSSLAKKFPYYSRHMLVTKESQWMQPEKGFLAGTIVAVSDAELGIKDLNGRDWNIEIDEETLVRPAVSISPGEAIKIIGTQWGANDFEADEIRPWAGKGRGNGGHSQKKRMMDGAGQSGNGRRGNL